MNPTEREKKILYCVVQEYIKTKTPVSSKHVLENASIERSGATIRNDMNRLMKNGYIFQPHTSAGRVPTDKGLRFYVNELRKIREEIKSKGVSVESTANFPIGDMEKVLTGAAKLLSTSTKGMVIIEKPSPMNLRIKRIAITSVSENFSIVSIITSLGLSASIPLQHSGTVAIMQIEDLLNKVMKNKTLKEFKTRLRDILLRINEFREIDFSTLGKDFLEIAEKLFMERYEDYITEGLYNLLSNQRINLKKFQNILGYVFSDAFYKDVFELNNEIYIGKEHGLRFLDDFSIMIGEFKVENAPIGRTAVIFDKFGNYDHIMDSFEFMTNRLTEYFTIVSRNV